MLSPYTKVIRAWNRFFDGPFDKLGTLIENAIAEMENNSKKYSDINSEKELEELRELRRGFTAMAFAHSNWVNCW